MNKITKKRICIVIIIFISLIIITCVGIQFFLKKDVEIEQFAKQHTIDENFTLDDNIIKSEENVILEDNTTNTETLEEHQEQIKENPDLSKKQTTQSQEQSKSSTNTPVSSSSTKAQEKTQASTQTSIQQGTTTTKDKTSTVQQTQQVPQQVTQSTQTQPSNSQATTQNTESFKINNSMIEKIKSVINSNPSSSMKQYGYNIVVDSSIVNQTSQFTFTETRVKNAIKYSFNTIKIYARDYLVNNEYRWTECYIL